MDIISRVSVNFLMPPFSNSRVTTTYFHVLLFYPLIRAGRYSNLAYNISSHKNITIYY